MQLYSIMACNLVTPEMTDIVPRILRDYPKYLWWTEAMLKVQPKACHMIADLQRMAHVQDRRQKL